MMRIVTWNCNMGYNKKEAFIKGLCPDIAIIQECGKIDKVSEYELWYGDNNRKGIGIFSYNLDLKLEIFHDFDRTIKYVMPVSVTGRHEFNLIAVWTQDSKNSSDKYIRSLHRAIPFYYDFIGEKPTFIAGDFNSNSIWDNLHGKKNHTEMVNLLEQRFSIRSVYHTLQEEEHGHETNNTFYMYRKENRGYHIDYCFAPSEWLKKVKSIEIGDYNKWHIHSDHMPLIIDF